MVVNGKFLGQRINPQKYFQLKTDITPVTSQPGLIQWNVVDGTYDMGLLNGSILQVGQETMFYGKAQGNILNGEPCQFAGVQGDHILMKKAVASEIDANPHYFIGVATENIANNAFGYVTWFGKINGVYTKTPANNDTQDWIAGDILYMNMSTGYLTKTKPSVPKRNIIVAAVIKEQTGTSESGILIVRPYIGIKLDDLDDVNGTAPVEGSFPVWNNTSKYFDFTAKIGDYLKINQTTQQTTVGRFSFPSLGAGDNTNYTNISNTGRLSYVGSARKQWAKYTANSITLINGTSANTVADLRTMTDGSYYTVTEASGVPGIDLIVDFVSVTAFEKCRVLGEYIGSSTHGVAIQVYNWSTLVRDTFNAMQTGFAQTTAGNVILNNYEFTVYDDTNYIGTGGNLGKVRIRFNHPMTGNPAHQMILDEVSLRQ